MNEQEEYIMKITILNGSPRKQNTAAGAENGSEAKLSEIREFAKAL